jgi:hypothetical protein
MPRVAIGQFAPTIGHSGSTFTADADSAEETIEHVLSVYGIAYLRAGTYVLSSSLVMQSGDVLLGQPDNKPTLQLVAGADVSAVTNAAAGVGGVTTGVTMKSLIIDQQGALQESGGGLVVTGIQDWTLEDIVIKKSYRFNFLALHQSVGVPNLTGTITLTKDSAAVVGVGTRFTTELSVGSLVKSAAGQLCWVLTITDDTHLTLTMPWGYTTESGVTYKEVQPNSGHYFNRLRFEGTVAPADENGGIDAAGFGVFLDSVVEYCEGLDTTDGGCAFVPDHCRNCEFNYLVGHDTGNSGISLETCEDCVVNEPSCDDNTDNGTQLISGTSRCEVIGGSGKRNTKDAFVVTYNTVNAGVPRSNVFRGVLGELNDGYAVRVNGADDTEVDDVDGLNNNTGGVIVNTENARVPDATNIHHSRMVDDRGGSKSQDRGVWIVAGTDSIIDHVTALDSQHVVAGIVDSGTNTTKTNNTT